MPVYEITRNLPVLSPTSALRIENADSSRIFLNDNLLHKDINYIILESDMVHFYIPLEESDSLVVKKEMKTSAPLISKSSLRTPYRLFSSSEILQKNSHYQITLKLKDQEFTNEFSSKLSPSYVSNAVLVIRNDIGEIGKNFSSQEISFAVHMASKDFDERLLLADYTDELEDTALITREKWVRYKAILDLLNSAYLSKVNMAGKMAKVVGNLEVSREHKIPYYNDMMKRFQSLFDAVDKDLNGNILGVSSIFGTFTKAGNTAYPLDDRLW